MKYALCGISSNGWGLSVYILFFNGIAHFFFHHKSLPGCRLAPGLQCVQRDPPGRGASWVMTARPQGLVLRRPRRRASGGSSSRGRVPGRCQGWRWFRLSGGRTGTAGVLNSAGGCSLCQSGSWQRPLVCLTFSFLCCVRSFLTQIWLLFQRYSKFILLKCHE